MPRGDTATVIAISDPHGGHKYGLCNPNVTLYEVDRAGKFLPYTPELTDTQAYLWELHARAVDRASKIGNDLILIHVGDQTSGNKYYDGLMSTISFNQWEIAFANMLPWMSLDNIKMVRLVFGTGSHEFGEGSSVLQLVARLRDKFPEVDIQAVKHGLITVKGVGIDYAHHGPGPGIRAWTRGNVVRHYTRSLMFDEIVDGRCPPAVILRGHYHTPLEEVVNIGPYETRTILLPSMCGLPDYAQQVTQSVYRITNGIAFIDVCDGVAIKPRWEVESLDVRAREEVG